MKNFFKILFSLTLCFVVVGLFMGCKDKNKTSQNANFNYVSEYRKNLFVGQAENVLATFTSGKREVDYIMDGNKTNLVDFGVITLKLNYNLGSALPKIELKVNDSLFVAECEQNPYDGSYVYDIQKQVGDNDTISLYLVDADITLPLNCISKNWKINYKEALNIFVNKNNKAIKENTQENVLKGEIYIKIVAEDKEMKNIYWYVLLVCSSGQTYANLIDVNTGSIVQS